MYTVTRNTNTTASLGQYDTGSSVVQPGRQQASADEPLAQNITTESILRNLSRTFDLLEIPLRNQRRDDTNIQHTHRHR